MAQGRPRQRGTVYLAVLAAATVVTVIGLSAIALARCQYRAVQLERDCAEAQLYAQAAVEMALHWISTDPDWRNHYAAGTLPTTLALGAGTCTLVLTDPLDGDLTNCAEDSVVVMGIGTKGAARHKTQVSLVAVLEAIQALKTCLHAGGEVQVKSGKTLTVTDGPLSTNGNLRIDGTVDGNAEGASRSGGGTVTGTLTVPVPAKSMPQAGVFDTYRNLAVTIPFPSGGTMEKKVLSPGSNPWGVTSPDGVYYMDTGGSDLTIRGVRLWGTLVIRAPGKKVIIDQAVLMEPYRSDYPVLIVDGNLEMKHRSSEFMVSELFWLTNFNPTGTPYAGVSDTDTLDAYPNEVHGLVHVTGTLLLSNSATVRGTIICEGGATCEEFNSIVYNRQLWTDPPMGYLTTRMKIAPGSWTQAVD